MMSRSFWQLSSIHFKEYFREPGILFWTLAFPAAMAWILGIAFSSDVVPTSRIAVVGDISQLPAGLVQTVTRPKGSNDGPGPQTAGLHPDTRPGQFAFLSATKAEAVRLLRQGRIVLYLERRDSDWSANFDPRNTEAELSYFKLRRLLGSGSSANEAPTLVPVPITDRGNRYVDFLVPGLLAMGVMNSCLWGIGWSLIELRIKKLLRRMVASPMRRTEFLMSFFAARLSLSLVEGGILFGFAWLYFDFSIQGSWPAFVLLFLAGNIAFWGLGVLLSSRAESTRTANGLINFVSMPMTIVGGVFFSYHNFPQWVANVIQYLPLAMLADGLRSVANEGAGLLAVWPASAVLLGFGGVCFLLAMRVYRWY